MRYGVAVLAACATLGCADRDRPAEVPVAALVTPAPPSGFVLMRGADTLAVERYTRSAAAVEGEITDAQDGGRVRYRADLAPDERIIRLTLRLFAKGAGTPRTEAAVRVQGDSLFFEQRKGGSVTTDHSAAPAGTLPYFTPSIALLEQVARRAHAVAGGRSVRLPMLSISSNRDPELTRPTVTRTADSVFVVVDAANQFRGATDANGRIVSGENPGQRLRVARIHTRP